jgi:hypothetical protein
MHFLAVALLLVVALAAVSQIRGTRGMTRLGNGVYLVACGIALSLIAAAAFAVIAGDPQPVVLAVAAVLALLIWLGGLAARYIVSGSRG